MKHLACLVIALTFLLVLPGQAAAQSRSLPYTPFWLKVADVVLVRIPMIPVSAASSAFFLATLPITFPTGVSEESAYLFVAAPWRFTSARFPGEFGLYVDGGTVFGGGRR